MSKSEAHYFKFSHNWSSGQRLCGDCNLSYDAGQHIEITTLKPFTNYVCPTGGGYGHSSTYTGALIHSLRTLHQHLCICGAEFVEEDNESWTLTWEMKDPWSSEWRTVSNTQSKHAAHAQRDGLLELIERGEDIRNVVLKDDAAPSVLDEVSAERERQDAKWGEQNHPNGTGPAVVWAYTGPAAYVAETAKAECQRLSAESLVTFADILLEEVAEAFAEEDPAKLRAELIQVAAVATQWVETIDRGKQ